MIDNPYEENTDIVPENEKLEIFDDHLRQFLTDVEIAVSLEVGGKTDHEDAYQKIKSAYKKLKRTRRTIFKEDQPEAEAETAEPEPIQDVSEVKQDPPA